MSWIVKRPLVWVLALLVSLVMGCGDASDTPEADNPNNANASDTSGDTPSDDTTGNNTDPSDSDNTDDPDDQTPDETDAVDEEDPFNTFAVTNAEELLTALDAAVSGDRIEAAAGTYTGSFTIPAGTTVRFRR